jgi:MFS family permease
LEFKPDKSGIRFGPFWLTPGVSRLNASTFFFSSFMFVTLVTFLNFLQPYILNDVLGVPADQQGAVTGYLNFFHEFTALMLMGFAGAISDRTGRRMVCVTGLLILAIGLILFPTAISVWELYFYRIIVAVGVAATSVMVIATMQDYPQEISRGKWGGVNSFITSFAVLAVSLLLLRIPGWFEEMGYESSVAGRYTFWIAAFAATVSALVIWLGWYRGQFASQRETRSPFSGFAAGVRAARRNPRLALAYGAGFAARGDLVVIGAFFSLWFVRAGADQGIDSAEALKQAGITLGALTLANWVWAPTYGWILDRINRVAGLAIGMALACLGYYAVGQVSDPFDRAAVIPATILLGIGEISAVIAGNALLGQEAPVKIRGSAAGVFSLVGTCGILFATLLGGVVFDRIAYTAPFTMMAAVNLLVAIIALYIWLSVRSRAAPEFN